jgi:hypothetical protein
MFGRSLFRLVLFVLLFAAFLFTFLPSITHASRFRLGTLNLPSHRRPATMRRPTFAPPQPSPRRHRIIATQRPLPALGHHEAGDVWAERADAVRAAFLQAYNSYVEHAAPHDELLPLSKAPFDKCVPFASRDVCGRLTLWRFGAGGWGLGVLFALRRAASTGGLCRI